MILMVLISLQYALSNSTESALMLFLLSPSCVPITIYGSFSRLQGIISAEISIRQYLHMKNILDLLLDFNKIFSHSISRIIRLND
jgi:hypothetical protein